MSPPTETLTFLFTDIEGSTRLWEEQTETMRSALSRHDSLMRETIAAAGGSVFKTAGDAFYAVFRAPEKALEVALTAQRALLNQTLLRVRIALHTGAAEGREDDYFGPPLNRVARLLAAGHGGQILLSDTTQPLLAAQLPEAFPPLRTLPVQVQLLPRSLTAFVGREPRRRRRKTCCVPQASAW